MSPAKPLIVLAALLFTGCGSRSPLDDLILIPGKGGPDLQDATVEDSSGSSGESGSASSSSSSGGSASSSSGGSASSSSRIFFQRRVHLVERRLRLERRDHRLRQLHVPGRDTGVLLAGSHARCSSGAM